MSFQSETEGGGHPPPISTHQAATGGSSSWRQDDAPTGSADDANEMDRDHGLPPPSRDVDQVMTALEATPQELGRIIEGESRERLARPASDGDWGVVEILPHLGDWDEVVTAWVRRILAEDAPVLEAVDDSLWAIEHDYANEDPHDALQRFSQLRQDLIGLLWGLTEEDWRRQAIHASHGPTTLHQLADRICDHDARYLAQARDALA